MTDSTEPTAAAAAEGDDRLTARRGDGEVRLTVTQIRRGLQPASPALAALAEVTGVGVLRRIGADQFAAGPLPLSQLGQDGAEPGSVLTWNGSCWTPTTGREPWPPAPDQPAGPQGPRRVVTIDELALATRPEHCGAVLRLLAGSEATVLLPATLPDGFEVSVLQAGEGQVRFVAAPGASLVHRLGHTRTAGRNARVTLLTTAGADAALAWLLTGDTGP
jgi:hypothetical protein